MNQKIGPGTNFIRAVPKIERSVNGAINNEGISYSILLSPIWQNIKSRLQYWARPKVEPIIEVEN
jgi:hypothetical protein